jgi:type IV pilus assembly protein PilW
MTLQRDIRQAGFGFNALNVLGCSLALPAPASRTLAQFAPVVINPPTADVPDGDANSDRLLIAFGSGNGSPEGDVVTAVLGLQLGVQAAGSFLPGDRVIAGPAAPTGGCALTLATVTAVMPPPSPVITVPSSGAVDGGTVFNLGQRPRILAYAIRGGNLTVCEYSDPVTGTTRDCGQAANYVAIANNIVSLRAQYGRPSNPPTSGVDTWNQVTPALACDPGPHPKVEWATTSAVRLVVVARNSQVDRDQITQQAPVWAGSGGAAINLSARANWQNYRYRTFETVIPIRNLPWMTGC